MLSIVFLAAGIFVLLFFIGECIYYLVQSRKHPIRPKPDYAKIARMEEACGIGQPSYPNINMLDAQKRYSGFSEWRAPSLY